MIFELTQVLNFSTIVLIIILPAIGTGIGQALASKSALKGMYVQPAAHNEIVRTFILGMALMETAEIVGIALSVLLIIDPSLKSDVLSTGIARFGIALALGIAGLVIGIVSAWPTIEACRAIARQPFFSGKILNLLLITQTLVQTPILFCFMIAWFVKTQAAQALTLVEGVRLLASGVTIGIGAVGPIIGLAWFAQSAIKGLGTNRKSYAKMFNFAFISQAIIETPILLAFVIAFLIVFSSTSPTESPVRWAVFLAASLASGFGTLIPSIQSGKIASAAGRQIAQNPHEYSVFSNASILAQALIDTFVIYAAVISTLMILFI